MRVILSIAAAVAALALVAAGAGAAAPPSCRTNATSNGHWESVFAHFSTKPPALKLAGQLRTIGYTMIRVQDEGCRDFEVMLPGLDTQKIRDEFTRQAIRAGYPGVSYETSGGDASPLPKGTWRAIFGTFRTAELASALLGRAAHSGFRLIDIRYAGPGRWQVEVPGVPQAQSQAFAREARSAGYPITYEIS